MENKIILSKESNEDDIKRYFEAILKLSQSDDEFPINLDEVWMLVYAQKDKAVRALKENFIESLDYIPLTQNGERSNNGRFNGGNKIEYKLTLSCMEYFIARKVRSVFEVYRKVFHKAANTTQPQLSEAEILLKMAQINVENERRMKALESELKEIKERTTTDIGRSTVVAYVTRHNISLDVKKYGAMGRKASTLCKKRSLATGKVNDPRWGTVSVYPDSILDEIFKGLK